MRAPVLGKRLAQPGKIFSEFDGLGLGHNPLAWLVEEGVPSAASQTVGVD